MKWITACLGLCAIAFGAWWGWISWSIVQLERGWSGLIAAAVIGSTGVLLLGLAALMARVDALFKITRANYNRERSSTGVAPWEQKTPEAQSAPALQRPVVPLDDPEAGARNATSPEATQPQIASLAPDLINTSRPAAASGVLAAAPGERPATASGSRASEVADMPGLSEVADAPETSVSSDAHAAVAAALSSGGAASESADDRTEDIEPPVRADAIASAQGTEDGEAVVGIDAIDDSGNPETLPSLPDAAAAAADNRCDGSGAQNGNVISLPPRRDLPGLLDWPEQPDPITPVPVVAIAADAAIGSTEEATPAQSQDAPENADDTQPVPDPDSDELSIAVGSPTGKAGQEEEEKEESAAAEEFWPRSLPSTVRPVVPLPSGGVAFKDSEETPANGSSVDVGPEYRLHDRGGEDLNRYRDLAEALNESDNALSENTGVLVDEPAEVPIDTAAPVADDEIAPLETGQGHKPETEGNQEAKPPLLRSYESQGITYYLYTDGSIEAHTPGGLLQFGSLQELRDYIEQRKD